MNGTECDWTGVEVRLESSAGPGHLQAVQLGDSGDGFGRGGLGRDPWGGRGGRDHRFVAWVAG